MTWNDAITDFSLYLKLERNLSKNTILAYNRDLKKLANWAEKNNLLPLNATSTEISKAIQDIAEQGLEASSQSRFVSSVKAFYKYLIFEDYLTDDPSELIQTPRISRKLPDVLSEEDIDEIINAIDLSEPFGERNRAMLEVLYGCGLRVSELINLKITHLYFDQNLIKVTGKGNKERLIPINDQAIKYLNIYLKEVRVFDSVKKGEEDMVFLNRRGHRLTRNMIFTIVKNTVEKAGIRKKVSPHTFRHSFASHMVNRGADIRIVQELLGHISITTTEIYTHLDQSKLRQAFDEFHPRANLE